MKTANKFREGDYAELDGIRVQIVIAFEYDGDWWYEVKPAEIGMEMVAHIHREVPEDMLDEAA